MRKQEEVDRIFEKRLEMPAAAPAQKSDAASEQAAVWPAREVTITLSHQTIGDELFGPMIRQALTEFMALKCDRSHYDFTASNGMRVVADFPGQQDPWQ